jgi:hypothetical protein
MLAAPAYALRPNTYVASYGVDSGSCSYTAPCRTFSYALSQVQAGGVVTAIDSAGNSSFTINKAVTIMAPPGVSPSIVPVSGGAAITINALPFDAVILDGLIINGFGAGSNGIVFNSGASLTVRNCVISNMTGDGLDAFPSLNSSHSISISNTTVSNNGGYGIFVRPTGSASVSATFDHVKTQYNGASFYGIALNSQSTTGWVNGDVTDSVSSNNGGGYLAAGNGGAGGATSAILTVARSLVTENNFGVTGLGQGTNNFGFVMLSQTMIANNTTPCSGIVYSYGDNPLSNNGALCNFFQIAKD